VLREGRPGSSPGGHTVVERLKRHETTVTILTVLADSCSASHAKPSNLSTRTRVTT
jgi:hypothetical protein